MTQVPESHTPVPPPAPAEVAAAAHQWQMGELHDARVVAGAGAIAKPGVAIVAVSLVVAVVGLRQTGIVGFIGLLAAFGVMVGLITLAYALKTALVGGDDWYLYTGGVVDARRRRVRAIPWSEVTGIERKRMGNKVSRHGGLMNPDTVGAYVLSLRDGSRVHLTAHEVFDDGARLGHRLEDLAYEAGHEVAG